MGTTGSIRTTGPGEPPGLACASVLRPRGRDRAVIAASSDRASGRRTWAGSRGRRPRAAARSATTRWRRRGRARVGRRARRATPRQRRARCRPRPPTHEQTWWGWPPSGQLPPPSRTSGPPRGAIAPGTPGNASHCRRRARLPRSRHRWRLGAGPRGELERGWRHPESRCRRLSCRGGPHRRLRRAQLGARRAPCQAHEAGRCHGRERVERPSRTRTPATVCRARRSPR